MLLEYGAEVDLVDKKVRNRIHNYTSCVCVRLWISNR